MKWLLSELFRLVFGCHHRDVSRVFTLGGRTYRVCCDCGAQFDYSLKTMSVVRRAARRVLPGPSVARQAARWPVQG